MRRSARTPRARAACWSTTAARRTGAPRRARAARSLFTTTCSRQRRRTSRWGVWRVRRCLGVANACPHPWACTSGHAPTGGAMPCRRPVLSYTAGRKAAGRGAQRGERSGARGARGGWHVRFLSVVSIPLPWCLHCPQVFAELVDLEPLLNGMHTTVRARRRPATGAHAAAWRRRRQRLRRRAAGRAAVHGEWLAGGGRRSTRCA